MELIAHVLRCWTISFLLIWHHHNVSQWLLLADAVFTSFPSGFHLCFLRRREISILFFYLLNMIALIVFMFIRAASSGRVPKPSILEKKKKANFRRIFNLNEWIWVAAASNGNAEMAQNEHRFYGHFLNPVASDYAIRKRLKVAGWRISLWQKPVQYSRVNKLMINCRSGSKIEGKIASQNVRTREGERERKRLRNGKNGIASELKSWLQRKIV